MKSAFSIMNSDVGRGVRIGGKIGQFYNLFHIF